MTIEKNQAHGLLKGKEVSFSCRCANRDCRLLTEVVFNKNMKFLYQTVCSHFISYQLEKGQGVFISFYLD